MPRKGSKDTEKLDYGDNYKQNVKTSNIYSKGKNKKTFVKKRMFNIAVSILSTIFAFTGIGMLYVYKVLNSFNYEALQETSSQQHNSPDEEIDGELKKEGSLLKDPKVLNVILFGIDDQSTKDSGRSDAILMISIDNRNKKLKLTTFMRDLWVKIPGHGEEKLNAAFAFGGPKLSVETIERTFGINIDRYAMIHFDGFAKVVDSLDGIDMDLTASETATINKLCIREGMNVQKKLPEKKGLHHLNGFQALNHSRNRDSARSDFDRTDRQRAVLSAIISKVKTASLKQILSIISNTAPEITMNFQKEEIIKLTTNFLTYTNYEICEYRLPEDNNFSNVRESNGAQALEINDLAEARYNLAKFLYEDSIQKNN